MPTLRLVPLAGGEPIEITRDQVLLGRDAACDVVVNDGSVSRKHARIERKGSSWTVIDHGSANGTFLDSRRVADSLLHHGQEVRFGAIGYRVEIHASTDRTIATELPGGEATVIQSEPLAVALPPPPSPSHTTPLPSAAVAPRPRTFASPPPGRWSPPSSSPVPPMAGAPPERKGRGPLFWIASGCGGCLVVLILVVAGIFGLVAVVSQGPVDAAKAQLADIKAGRIDQAYGRLSESYQARVSRADFEAFVDSNPELKSTPDTVWWNRSVHNNTARLNRQLTTPSGDVPLVIALAKEKGAWRITRIQVKDRGPEENLGGEDPNRENSGEPESDSAADPS